MKCDFIVIGGGIAGASIAYELAQHACVCLLEGEARPGLHATGRSAALFAPSYGGTQIRAITRASREFFNQPPPGFCERPLLTARGCLYPARPDQVDGLDAMITSIQKTGGIVHALTEKEAIERVPSLRKGYMARAAFDPDAMDIDVDALHQGFLRGAKAAGARLVTDAWVKAAFRFNGHWAIETGGGLVSAPVLINAAGAWADEVAVACGATAAGLQPFRRTAMLVDPPPSAHIDAWPAVIDVDEKFYFKPDAGKLLLSPAEETPVEPCDAQPEELDIAIGVDRVQSALDINVRRVNHSWAGLRTFAPDRVPVVGFDPMCDGFFWCAGQGGYGVQTAPALARLASALAREEAIPADIEAEGLFAADVSPARFSR